MMKCFTIYIFVFCICFANSTHTIKRLGSGKDHRSNFFQSIIETNQHTIDISFYNCNNNTCNSLIKSYKGLNIHSTNEGITIRSISTYGDLYAVEYTPPETENSYRHIKTAYTVNGLTTEEESWPAPVEKLVVGQEIELEGVTRIEILQNQKSIEKAIAKSLGVASDKVVIIEINVITTNTRRRLLQDTNIQIIYEVDVENEEEAEGLQLSMQTNTFEEAVTENIESETEDLSFNIASIGTPEINTVQLDTSGQDEDHEIIKHIESNDIIVTQEITIKNIYLYMIENEKVKIRKSVADILNIPLSYIAITDIKELYSNIIVTYETKIGDEDTTDTRILMNSEAYHEIVRNIFSEIFLLNRSQFEVTFTNVRQKDESSFNYVFSKSGSLHRNRYGFLTDNNGFLLIGKGNSKDTNAKHHIHITSRYDHVWFKNNGEVLISECDDTVFINSGNILLRRFTDTEGLNLFRSITSKCEAVENEFGFALGSWCQDTWLDGLKVDYYRSTEVSGEGIEDKPGNQGIGIILYGERQNQGWNLVIEGKGYFQYMYKSN